MIDVHTCAKALYGATVNSIPCWYSTFLRNSDNAEAVGEPTAVLAEEVTAALAHQGLT